MPWWSCVFRGRRCLALVSMTTPDLLEGLLGGLKLCCEHEYVFPYICRGEHGSGGTPLWVCLCPRAPANRSLLSTWSRGNRSWEAGAGIPEDGETLEFGARQLDSQVGICCGWGCRCKGIGPYSLKVMHMRCPDDAGWYRHRRYLPDRFASRPRPPRVGRGPHLEEASASAALRNLQSG
jgi:hypothetical protein